VSLAKVQEELSRLIADCLETISIHAKKYGDLWMVVPIHDLEALLRVKAKRLVAAIDRGNFERRLLCDVINYYCLIRARRGEIGTQSDESFVI